MQVISMNGDGEGIERGEYPGTTFVSTCDTASGVMRLPYVMLSALIDHARKESIDRVMIINSDNELSDPNGLMDRYIAMSETGLVFANRHDHNGDLKNPTMYRYGFDVFIIHSRFYDLIPRSMFCLGQTWWDYWIPYRFVRAGIPIHLVKEPLFLHHRHPQQYNAQEWVRMTDHFCWMENYPRSRQPQSINNEVFRTIMKHAK